MKTNDSVSRRDFLQRLSALGFAGLGGGALLSACGGGDSGDGGASEGTGASDAGGQTASLQCNDLSGLTEQEKQSRRQMVQSLQYVEESPNPDQLCSNCNFWQPPSGDDPCGGCTLIKGPIHPDGYCTSWVKMAS